MWECTSDSPTSAIGIEITQHIEKYGKLCFCGKNPQSLKNNTEPGVSQPNSGILRKFHKYGYTFKKQTPFKKDNQRWLKTAPWRKLYSVLEEVSR